MYTLRLIFTGLVFLAPAADNPERELWVLFPDPATIRDFVSDETTGKPVLVTKSLPEHQVLLSYLKSDGDCHQEPLGDRSHHYNLSLNVPGAVESKVVYTRWQHDCTSPSGCDAGVPYFDLRQDFGWVVSMEGVIQGMIDQGCFECTADIDGSLLESNLDKDRLSSRLLLHRGRIKTGLLWGELTPEGKYTLQPTEFKLEADEVIVVEARAMARTVVVDILIDGGVTRLNRISAENEALAPIEIPRGQPGSFVILSFSNYPKQLTTQVKAESLCLPLPPEGGADGVTHFRAYYRMLEKDNADAFDLAAPVPAESGSGYDNPSCEPVNGNGP